MTVAADITDTVHDQIVDLVRAGKKIAIGAAESFGTPVRDLAPDALTDRIPTPAAWIELGFGFAEQALGTTRDVVKQALAAVLPDDEAPATA